MTRLNKRIVLMLAGLFFMVPLLGKTAVAKRLGGGIHHPPSIARHPHVSVEAEECSEVDLDLP